jgi:hypothetical protein
MPLAAVRPAEHVATASGAPQPDRLPGPMAAAWLRDVPSSLGTLNSFS